MMVTVREIKLPHPLPACGERSEPGGVWRRRRKHFGFSSRSKGGGSGGGGGGGAEAAAAFGGLFS